MKELVAVLESLGLQNVKTYIQSGNAVFQSKSSDTQTLGTKISAAIKKSHGFEPKVWLLDASALTQAIKANPYPEAEAEPTTLHLNFLASTPSKPDLKSMEKIKTETERFHLEGNVCYLHAPDGVGRSKLAANMERLLGVPMTGRNWRTVCKIMELAEQ
jgi:uncharacterized protein (DUF1697 family)